MTVLEGMCERGDEERGYTRRDRREERERRKLLLIFFFSLLPLMFRVQRGPVFPAEEKRQDRYYFLDTSS